MMPSTAAACPNCKGRNPGNPNSGLGAQMANGNKIGCYFVIGILVLIIGLCVFRAVKPVYCPIHNVAMTDTGKLEEIPPLSGHTYEIYRCPEGHEIQIDQCPSCSEDGDRQFQQKELEKLGR